MGYPTPHKLKPLINRDLIMMNKIKGKMKIRHLSILMLFAWTVFRVSAQEQVLPDSAANGNLMIFKEPLNARIEIPILAVD